MSLPLEIIESPLYVALLSGRASGEFLRFELAGFLQCAAQA
jgi:hypothetical protein